MTNPRRKAVPYLVTWCWRHDDDPTDKYDEIMATDAMRAVSKLKKALSEEYADVTESIVVMDVGRI